MTTRWLITICLCVTAGCTPEPVEPLSVCPQPYANRVLDSKDIGILKDARERAAPICERLRHGCSMNFPRKTGKGFVVSVMPVAGINGKQCSYASHTQTYYLYDRDRKFIDSRGRFMRERPDIP